MYYEGRLYWSDYYTGHIYSVALDGNGLLDDASFRKENCGIYSVCTPVAADDRVYLAGKMDDNGVVGVFAADDLQEAYIAGNATGNIMSTPILLDEAAQNTVFVQSYGAEGDNSKLYILQDSEQTTENELVMLVDIEPANYAYQQLAFDAEGALYCTNDEGFLIKYHAAEVPAPVFTKDLTETTVVYEQGATAMALEVEATISDGTLSYRWQVQAENGQWQDINGANTKSYIPDTQAEGTKSYRCVAVNTLYGETATAISKAITIKVLAPEPEVTEIAVTFRLIGDSAHEDEAHEEYVTWIPTTEYKNLSKGTTVYDVFQRAITENKLDQKFESRKGYVTAIQAPAELGGYWLDEFENGTFSGWMFTVNGEHPSVGMKGVVLNEGDAIVFHYVDDWAKEEDANTWLEAEDITPEEYLEGKQPVHTHTEEIIPAKAATCTESGLTEGKKCSTCGEILVKQETVAAKDHAEVEVPGKAATCTESGLTEGKKCSACGEILVKQETVAAKGHKETVVNAKAATQEAEGYTGDKVCSVCETVLEKGTVIPKLEAPAHTHTEEVIPSKAATCTESGLTEGKKCSACGEILVKQETVATKGHTEVEAAGKDATCTEEGLTEGVKCAVCGEILIAQETLRALGHEEEIIDAREATWYAEGYSGDIYCSVCGVLVEKGTVTEKTDDRPDNPFVDVKENKFYYTPVLWAVEAGITNGITETEFKPGDACTRGHVVTFLWRAAGSPEPETTENPFTDVKEGKFYYKAVLWAVENGITNGTTATTFEPGTECTRGQVVTFLHRFAGEPAPTSEAHPFTDISKGPFYYNAVLWAVEKGITNGATATTFDPKGQCNRGQIVTFLFRLMTQQ